VEIRNGVSRPARSRRVQCSHFTAALRSVAAQGVYRTRKTIEIAERFTRTPPQTSADTSRMTAVIMVLVTAVVFVTPTIVLIGAVGYSKRLTTTLTAARHRCESHDR